MRCRKLGKEWVSVRAAIVATTLLGLGLSCHPVAAQYWLTPSPYPPVPPPRYEPVPPPPEDYMESMIWLPGHWRWNGARYDWIPGHYVARPSVANRWSPGRWVPTPRGPMWVGPHWE
jgi:hypothetical protein